jgi:integrase
MASITKRPNGKYRARYRDAADMEHARHFDRKVDAQRWLDEVTAAVVRGDYVEPRAGLITLGEYAKPWLAARVHLKPKTVAGYESLLRTRVLPRWGDVPLGRVSFEGVSAWVTGMVAEGLSASRTQQAYHLLTSILDDAVKGSRIPRNPARGVDLPRIISRTGRYLTHGQLGDLADACGDFDTLVLMLGYCGIRWGEAAALTVGRVDPLRGRIWVVEAVSEVNGVLVFGKPKAHQSRSVPVPGFLREMRAVAMEGKKPHDRLFTSRDGAVLRNGNFRRDVFDRAARSVDLDGFTLHELKHTAASLAITAGASVKAVQRMLGHASARSLWTATATCLGTSWTASRTAWTSIVRISCGLLADWGR